MSACEETVGAAVAKEARKDLRKETMKAAQVTPGGRLNLEKTSKTLEFNCHLTAESARDRYKSCTSQ